jgi:hypothetical protein
MHGNGASHPPPPRYEACRHPGNDSPGARVRTEDAEARREWLPSRGPGPSGALLIAAAAPAPAPAPAALRARARAVVPARLGLPDDLAADAVAETAPPPGRTGAQGARQAQGGTRTRAPSLAVLTPGCARGSLLILGAPSCVPGLDPEPREGWGHLRGRGHNVRVRGELSGQPPSGKKLAR